MYKFKLSNNTAHIASSTETDDLEYPKIPNSKFLRKIIIHFNFVIVNISFKQGVPNRNILYPI